MPRVSLLLADDVGLGKTIEAGLILSELLLRRRIRRVLVLCPAALRGQWQQEMRDKFSLTFDAVDREETHALRKRIGLDANPWRTFPRIVTSYYYLRQPDVLEQFRAACAQREGTANLPWDLLIVDEAHNLMPSNFGRDSDLAEMLRQLSPHFEHRLFLTATPHNGHTRCFSGLLEQLDPVRFTQTTSFSTSEKAQIGNVVVRRLKSEINHLDDSQNRPRRFAERSLEPVPLFFSAEERAVSTAFGDFRSAVRSLIAQRARTQIVAGTFAVEVLNKRLLSCPATFAESWNRFTIGLQEHEAADASDVAAAQRAVDEDLDDDRERDSRANHAAKTAGAWLKPLASELEPQIAAIDGALSALKLDRAVALADPVADERFDRLCKLINTRLRNGNAWSNDERLIIFTEYKTTQSYLKLRLSRLFGDQDTAIRELYGGMETTEREAIKTAFNDPLDPIRILIATDAASEGLNLQETARLLLHYEIPWNPARLEQRNGRLDRHGQARDVVVFHFTSEEDADLKFLGRVVLKVEAIREDLGSMGEVFDAAFQRRFVHLDSADEIADELDRDIQIQKDRTEIPIENARESGTEELERLKELCRAVDLSPDTLRETLQVALGVGIGQPRLDGPDARGRFRLVTPIPDLWTATVDDYVRMGNQKHVLGALPALVFDPQLFVRTDSGRPVFRPDKDSVLLHLSHPMLRQALSTFAMTRFAGGAGKWSASRWTVRTGDVPDDADALVLLTVEELGINELREPFHHWVTTLRIPVRNGVLGETLPWRPAADEQVPGFARPELRDRAIEMWFDVAPDLRDRLEETARELTTRMTAELDSGRDNAVAAERERFRARLAEVRKAMSETTIARITRERDELVARMQQISLFGDLIAAQDERLQDLDAELERRKHHYTDLLTQLEREQDRVLKLVLPKRFALRGSVQVFPVAVEIRFPEGTR